MNDGDPWLDGARRTAWREALARKYPKEDEARMFVDRVGLDGTRIAFEKRADITWFNILEEARKQGPRWVHAVLERAFQDFPDDDGLKRLRDGAAVRYVEGPAISSANWRGRGMPTPEKMISSQSALVSVSFLELGLRCARAVVHLQIGAELGTGFLISGDLLVTNHHVLHSREQAVSATVRLNYQKTADGPDAEIQVLGLDAGAVFYTSKDDDLTLVRVKGEPTTRWGAIPVEPVRVQVGDRVNIIQHPGGQQKQLSFFHNLVQYAGEDRVQYLTDTLPGSSGAPVFDKDWRLVAVHHTGGWFTEPGSNEQFFRNQGVHVDRLIAAIRSIG